MRIQGSHGPPGPGAFIGKAAHGPAGAALRGLDKRGSFGLEQGPEAPPGKEALLMRKYELERETRKKAAKAIIESLFE